MPILLNVYKMTAMRAPRGAVVAPDDGHVAPFYDFQPHVVGTVRHTRDVDYRVTSEPDPTPRFVIQYLGNSEGVLYRPVGRPMAFVCEHSTIQGFTAFDVLREVFLNPGVHFQFHKTTPEPEPLKVFGSEEE